MTDKAATDLDVFQNIVQLSGDFPKLTEPLISAIDKERGLLIDSFFNLTASLGKDRVELIDETFKILGSIDK